MKILIASFTMRRSIVLSLPLQLGFPGQRFNILLNYKTAFCFVISVYLSRVSLSLSLSIIFTCLWISLYVSVCLSICFYMSLSVSVWLYQFLYAFVCPVCLYLFLHVFVCSCLSLSLSLSLFVFLTAYSLQSVLTASWTNKLINLRF